MTDKEKIKFWAKGRLFEIMNGIGENDAKNILTDLLSLIDSMQEEPVSEDFKIALEKKVREAQDWTYIEEEGGECPLNEEFGAYDLEEFAMWGAKWQKEKDEEEKVLTYKHGFEDCKEQLLAKAVDALVHTFDNGYIRVGTQLLANNEYGLKVGDKVKVIVIKED